MRPAARVPALVFLGSLLLQLAWVAAVPPFTGMDEFDHAYRAVSVADGHWHSQHQATGYVGRGDLVRVPGSLAVAAKPVCDSYTHISERDCSPVDHFTDGTVTIASGAARYNPVLYWALGTVARPFEGATALYAMRVASALGCSLLMGLAAWCLGLWARTAWPVTALVVSLTPVALYGASTPAPNGPEMFAALVVWAALLGLRYVDPDDPRSRTLVLVSLPAAVVLGGVRSLGPLWLCLVLASVAGLVGLRRCRRHLHALGWIAVLAGAVLLVATAASAWWTRAAGANALAAEQDKHLSGPWSHSAGLVPFWFLQSIAAFPDKTDAGPGAVYAIGAGLILGMLGLGFSRARGALRLHIVLVPVLAVAVPCTLSALTYARLGPVWQGRYALPFALGVLLVASLALDETRTRLPAGALLPLLVALGVEQAMGPVSVLVDQRRTSPLAGSSAWLGGSVGVILPLVLLGVLAWVVAVATSAPHPSDTRTGAPRTPARIRTGWSRNERTDPARPSHAASTPETR